MGIIQNVRRNKTTNGKSSVKRKLPKSPHGIDKSETLSPKNKARISWVENNPQINISLEWFLKEKNVPKKAKLKINPTGELL